MWRRWVLRGGRRARGAGRLRRRGPRSGTCLEPRGAALSAGGAFWAGFRARGSSRAPVVSSWQAGTAQLPSEPPRMIVPGAYRKRRGFSLVASKI